MYRLVFLCDCGFDGANNFCAVEFEALSQKVLCADFAEFVVNAHHLHDCRSVYGEAGGYGRAETAHYIVVFGS